MIPLFLENGCSVNAIVAFGNEACGKFKGVPKGFIFAETSLNIELTAALAEEGAVLDFLNTLSAYSIAERTQADITLKPAIYPYYPKLVNFETNGGDPKVETEGFGSGTPNGINPYSETFTIVDGGECLYKQLQKLEGRELQVYKVDENDTLYGTIKRMDDKPYLRGMKAYVSVTPRENNGTNAGAILVLVTYSNQYKVERDAQIAISLDEEVKALRQIAIRPVGANTFKVVSACSGNSVTEGNSALSAAIVAHKEVLLDTATGAAYAGATLTYNATNDLFTSAETVLSKDIALFTDLYVKSAGTAAFMYLIGNTASQAKPFYTV